MKRNLILLVALLLLSSAALYAQTSGKKKGKKEIPHAIEGKQKVRQSSYDTICRFTSFDNKKIYFCNFDYTTVDQIIAQRRPKWGSFQPVKNYLYNTSRAPMRVCAVFAINPQITDEATRNALIEEAVAEADTALCHLARWMAEDEMPNKVQINVAQVDYRYWKGTEYFSSEPPTDDVIVCGVVLYFGTKKIDLFPSAAADAKSFNDVKFFPNDATVQPSYAPLLDELAKYMKDDDRLEVLITGYSDNQGTTAYCEGVARQRAVEVKKALLMRGVPEYRIELVVKGAADPIGDNSTYEGRIANNRVSLTIQ